MTYHAQPKPHPKPHRSVQNLTTPATVYVANGSIVTYALPCYYQEVHPPIRAHRHCKDWHDHVGTPSPNHPDHSCQPHWEYAAWWTGIHGPGFPDFHGSPIHWRRALRHLIDMRCLIPIHLTEEGYTKVSVNIKDKPEGLTVDAWIDSERDHVIKIMFDAEVDECELEAKDYRFSVVAEGEFKDRPHNHKARSVVMRGVLHIDPNIIDEV